MSEDAVVTCCVGLRRAFSSAQGPSIYYGINIARALSQPQLEFYAVRCVLYDTEFTLLIVLLC